MRCGKRSVAAVSLLFAVLLSLSIGALMRATRILPLVPSRPLGRLNSNA